MQLPDNIRPILRNISTYYSSVIEKQFVDDCKTKWDDFNITSPIEMVLMVSLICVGLTNNLKGKIEVFPQYHIGDYRVDFCVKSKNHSIVVECDSQAFHDRSEKERAYEKKKDRYLQKNNYKVFRFTGRDILSNPLAIANEVISFAMDMPESDLVSLDKWGI